MKFPGPQTPEMCCILRICQMVNGDKRGKNPEKSDVEKSSKCLCGYIHTFMYLHSQTGIASQLHS